MKVVTAILLCSLFALTLGKSVSHPDDSVLQSSIDTLVFRRGAQTTFRRTIPVDQLSCEGGSARDRVELYPATVMCKNIGGGQGNELNWKCETADLHPSVQLGGVEVSCEGYTSSRDPYVLRGSCGLSYELDYRPDYLEQQRKSQQQQQQQRPVTKTTTVETTTTTTAAQQPRVVVNPNYNPWVEIFVIIFMLFIAIMVIMAFVQWCQDLPHAHTHSNGRHTHHHHHGGGGVHVVDTTPPIIVSHRHPTYVNMAPSAAASSTTTTTRVTTTEYEGVSDRAPPVAVAAPVTTSTSYATTKNRGSDSDSGSDWNWLWSSGSGGSSSSGSKSSSSWSFGGSSGGGGSKSTSFASTRNR